MKTDEFWTFLTTAVVVNTVDSMSPVLEITGSFAYIKIDEANTSEEAGTEPSLMMHPFTEEPITVTLPTSMLNDKELTDVSGGDVIDLMNKVFSLPFKAVPKAPSDAPIHKVPPTRRPAFLAAIKKLERS